LESVHFYTLTLQHFQKKSLLTCSSSVAIPLNARISADPFSLDLKTPENKNGSLDTGTLYKYLIDVRTFGFANNGPALSWQRRMLARKAAEALTETTLKVVKAIPKDIERDPKSITSGIISSITGAIKGVGSKIPLVGKLVRGSGNTAHATSGSLHWYGQNVARELMAHGRTPEEIADILWLTAVGGVGATISVVRSSYFSAVSQWEFGLTEASRQQMCSVSSPKRRISSTGLRSKSS
jgi:hypothetical protein